MHNPLQLSDSARSAGPEDVVADFDAGKTIRTKAEKQAGGSNFFQGDSSTGCGGLYDPTQEHDSCGVGFLVDLTGARSHQIVQQGVEILANLHHRGACGCDPRTSDGAGMLTQMPHRFFDEQVQQLGFDLPPPGESGRSQYGVGFLFLPAGPEDAAWVAQELEEVIAQEGQQLLGWRDVPVNNEALGWIGRSVQPIIRQVFIGRGTETPEDLFEWKLYVIRRVWSLRVHQRAGKREGTFAYAASFSSRTIVYKGLMLADQLDQFYPDLQDESYETALALVHQRYSTNTFPTWELAQPFRFLAHNGEINTLRGNFNWMTARQAMFRSQKLGDDLQKIFPVCTPGASDSATFDNVLEMLVASGRSLPQAISMMVPEPWENHQGMPDHKKAYYEYNACLLEPWDGPASIAFTDGTAIGALLDRNGLRPSRYWVTQDHLVIMASEAGVLQVPPDRVIAKGRLQPGRMFLVDTAAGQIISDETIKDSLAAQQPYRQWLTTHQIRLEDLPAPKRNPIPGADQREALQRPSRSRGDLLIHAAGNGAKTNGVPHPHSCGTSDRRHSGPNGAGVSFETSEKSPAAQGHHPEASTNGSAFPQHQSSHSWAMPSLVRQQRAHGYTLEDLKVILAPMAETGKEPIGSMGADTPLAVLSRRPQLLYNYFKQLFAQVTNPPLDAIREEVVTSLVTHLGSEGNLLEETAQQCRNLRLEHPILSDYQLAQIRELDRPGLKPVTLSTLYRKDEGAQGLRQRVEELRQQAVEAIDSGATILVLSDRGFDQEWIPIPALLVTSAVHHHLIRKGARTRCGLVLESGEPRECHHFCLLFGYGATAINPYLALSTIEQMHRQEMLPEDLESAKAQTNYVQAVCKGILKVMSKMGISTLASYRGAQIFEAVGLSQDLIDDYFQWTPSRLQGVDLQMLHAEGKLRHDHAFPPTYVPQVLDLDIGGEYAWRRKGESHLFNPAVVSKLQSATRLNSREEFKQFCQLIDQQSRTLYTLRGLLDLVPVGPAVPLEEVEPATEIVKRFATGAMSYGSISREAHETLAVAMNRIGGRSNTGEGGEDPARFQPDPNGDNRRSSIKQVASGRFGVTSLYLVNSDELQIKMAQGAKPGEGGQLPGHKVNQEIARVRHSTPGVGLISPPPHHDIYSIEDLAQLIHDLKNANHLARVSVKLVAEVGVGTVAAGVAKGKSDVILISGHDGGTGASPQTSIKHAGLPWELGLAETHQVLLKNNLRGRVIVQVDGQMRTARDLAIATLLGAEEYGIATAALVVMGCIMMRKCHLNTCPVGIATQDPQLRQKFAGQPEHVVNYFILLAEELRELMASLGFRTINEMVGRVDALQARTTVEHPKAKHLDLSCLLTLPSVPESFPRRCVETQDHGLEKSLDCTKLLPLCQPALELDPQKNQPVSLDLPVRNVNRTVGTILSSEVTRRFGAEGLPEDTIDITLRGSAGQSLLAFGAPGVTIRVHGDVNDYCGKGLSGGKIVVQPPARSPFHAEGNIICGNVALYGATSGELYVNGIAGERFCVRNSGALAVVEGIGDHGCEYMTGGRVVILGTTGRNFAAGMSGGIAYVLDEEGHFASLVNCEMVDLEPVSQSDDAELILSLVRKHVQYTESCRGRYVLENFESLLERFVKVMPLDYRRALQEDAQRQQQDNINASPVREVARG